MFCFLGTFLGLVSGGSIIKGIFSIRVFFESSIIYRGFITYVGVLGSDRGGTVGSVFRCSFGRG